MRATLLVVCLVALAACSPEERAAQRREINSALPPGCKMYDMGGYADLKRLVVVTCDGRRTSTTNEVFSSGKTTAGAAAVVIQEH